MHCRKCWEHLLFFVFCALLVVFAFLFGKPANGAEYADETGWYESLLQPDHTTTSCCGEADAYYADAAEPCPPGTEVSCYVVAIITDTRPDHRVYGETVINREHIPPGTKVIVPPWKRRKVGSGNNTGHTIVFVHEYEGDRGAPYYSVYCYEPTGGV